jgi:hypothetical protein
MSLLNTLSRVQCDYRRGLDCCPNLLGTHVTRGYILQITVTQTVVFSVTVFTALLGNFFQQWKFLCSRAHILAGWRPSHTKLLIF